MSGLIIPVWVEIPYQDALALVNEHKDKLVVNQYMGSRDFYNKELMNTNNVYDEDWHKRIVLRIDEHNTADKEPLCDLNKMYMPWLKRMEEKE